MFQYSIVGESFDDKFCADTVEIATSDADDGFLIHVFKIGCKNNDLLFWSRNTTNSNSNCPLSISSITQFDLKEYEIVEVLSKNADFVQRIFKCPCTLLNSNPLKVKYPFYD